MGRKNPALISSYALLDSQGQNLIDTSATFLAADESDYDYFKEPVRTQESYASPVEFDEITGQPFLYFSSPVRDSAGRTIIGVLRARYRANVLQDMIADAGLEQE